MLLKQEGILLRKTKYGESSLILEFLTEEYETLTTIISGLKSKSGQQKLALLQIGACLKLVLYYKPTANMHRIKELTPTFLALNTSSSVIRGNILMFIVEMTRNAIRKTGGDSTHFKLLKNYILKIDGEQELALLPIKYLIAYSKVLGFEPNFESYLPGSSFDLKHGIFQMHMPHAFCLSEENSNFFYEIILDLQNDRKTIRIPKSVRQQILDQLIIYYQFHIEGFQKPKSLEVLHHVFS